jgi:hypothetical protein
VISTPTTLVIGAGASTPYGMPTGPQLLDNARRLAPASLDGVFEPIVDALGVSATQLASVIEELQHHKAPTLDGVLEQRPDLDPYIRTIIAALMFLELTQRRAVEGPPEDLDWLQLLAERLRDGSGSDSRGFLDANRGLRIVTFNFDSLIERSIANTVSRLFKDCDPHTAEEVASGFEIIHLHGKLPPPTSLEPEWITEAAEQITLLPPPPEALDSGVSGAARRAIREASVVCFLGFGYHRSNRARLGINGSANGTDFFGSAFGVPDGPREWIEHRVPGIRLGTRDDGCAEVLDQFYVFRD